MNLEEIRFKHLHGELDGVMVSAFEELEQEP